MPVDKASSRAKTHLQHAVADDPQLRRLLDEVQRRELDPLTAVREIMEIEVAAQVGAGLGERAPEDRSSQRNGYRPRRWDTRVGEIELAIPKLRSGSYFPDGGAKGAKR